MCRSDWFQMVFQQTCAVLYVSKFRNQLIMFYLNVTNIHVPTHGFSDSLVHKLEHLLQLMESGKISSNLSLTIPWLL